MAYSVATINILSAFLILILGLVLGNTIGNIVKRVLKGVELSSILKKQFKLKIPIETYISVIVRYTIILIALGTALTQIGLSPKIIWWAVGIIALATIIFTLLAFKDWIPNILAGLYLKKSQKIKRGDHIHVKGVSGKVLHSNLLETKIETKSGDIIFVPNSILTKDVVKEEK